MSALRAAKLKWYYKNRQQINQKRREQYRKSQHNSVDDVDNLNQSEFEDRDHMNEEDLYKTNDTDQCSLLFNHDNTFYDTLINETCYDLEKNTLDSDEETDIVTDTLGSTGDEESFDENETDVVIEEDGNDNEQKNEMFNDQFQRDYDETDISVCLLTLKTKHNLTFECLNDIRKLLIVLKVQNVPSSIYHIRKLINTKSRSTPCTLSSTGTSSMIICQKCERVSFSKTSCSHIDCENHEKYTTNPYNYIYFDIRDQLQQIFRETVLSNSNDQIAQNKSSSTEKKSRKDTHKIRVFPTNEDNQTQLRSTARCQLILNKFSKLTHNKQCLNDEKESNLRLGYSGKCSLTDLTYFDHGYSFLMDTLHTIYHGAFFLRHKKAYTFFILGRIASTVNGTKNLPREIENNLQLIKNSSILLDMYCISSPLYLFISDLQDCKSNSPIVSNNYQVQKPTSTIHDNDKQELLLKFDSHDNIKQESPEKEAIFNDEEKVEKQQELSINLDALKQEHKINLCNEPEEALPNSELKQEEAIKDEQDQSSLKRNFV
ncbi:unnamed protein product [Rotaria sp. Silwood2]|nr:unnamed protein product [Rotaria sp. Silwood2]